MAFAAHSWESVLAGFSDLARDNPVFVPMNAAVEQIAHSSYASGLFPVKSMQSLHLYQHERFEPYDEQLHLDCEEGAFVVRYLSGGDPRYPWTKRGPDALALLDRAIHHVRWFSEYRTAAEDKRQ